MSSNSDNVAKNDVDSFDQYMRERISAHQKNDNQVIDQDKNNQDSDSDSFDEFLKFKFRLKEGKSTKTIITKDDADDFDDFLKWKSKQNCMKGNVVYYENEGEDSFEDSFDTFVKYKKSQLKSNETPIKQCEEHQLESLIL